MFQIDNDFIDICNKNIELVSQACLDVKPIKLHSFTNFEKYEDNFWILFDEFVRKEKNNSKRNIRKEGYAKIDIKHENSNDFIFDIPVVKFLSNYLFSKIYKFHKVTCFISISDFDKGTSWHKDYEESNPYYLICMNLAGKTRWEFEGYDDIHLSPGDLICQHGSISHQVTPDGPRLTIAGHSSIENIIL